MMNHLIALAVFMGLGALLSEENRIIGALGGLGVVLVFEAIRRHML
jgi:hypothetical protein